MKLIRNLEDKLGNIINRISDRAIAIVMAAGLMASLFPVLMLAFYNYPCADDFSASDTAHWAWVNTGSVLEVLKAAIENVIFNYKEWSGVYTSVFWTSLQPGLFGERFYGVTTLVSVGLFVWAGVYLTYVIFGKYMKHSRYSAISICALYLFTSIQCMPDGNEGLYWHAGGANYTWAFAFLLFLVGVVLSIYKESNRKKRSIQLILACILAILVGGGNYITALQGCIWLVLMDAVMIIADRYQTKDSYTAVIKKNLLVILPTLVTVAAFMASVLAPGNQVRMGKVTGMNPIKAVLVSFYYCLTMTLEEWLYWPVWMLLAISIPFMWNIVKKQQFSFQYPGIVAILGYCLVSAGFTPCLYAQGMIQAGRLRDTVYFILILVLYAVTFYITGWVYHKIYQPMYQDENQNRYEKRHQREKTKGNQMMHQEKNHKVHQKANGKVCSRIQVQEEKEQGLSKVSKSYIIGLLLFWTIGSVLHMGVDTDVYIGTEAAYALISGQAKSYREENEARIALLKSTKENVILPKFTDAPTLLQFDDISPNAEDWLNEAMAEYYGKESVQREE